MTVCTRHMAHPLSRHTSHTSHVTRHASHVTRHTLHPLTHTRRHTPSPPHTHAGTHATRHTSHITHHTLSHKTHNTHHTSHKSHVTHHAGTRGASYLTGKHKGLVPGRGEFLLDHPRSPALRPVKHVGVGIRVLERVLGSEVPRPRHGHHHGLAGLRPGAIQQ